MRYAIHPALEGQYMVVDRRYPLRPVLSTKRLGEALTWAFRLSLRSVWGW
jgi:hypothetical protein